MTLQEQAAKRPAPKAPSPYTYGGRHHGVEFLAFCHPPYPDDLNLAQLEIEGNAPTNKPFARKIRQLVSDYGEQQIHRVYAPNASRAPATLASRTEYRDLKLELGSGIHLALNPDLNAEGLMLSPGQGIFFNTKGCWVLVFCGKGLCCVAHAGRDSLIDRERLLTGKPSREYESIIDAVMAEFSKRGVTEKGSIYVRGLFGLDPKTFDHDLDHPEYGPLNRKIAMEVNKRGITAHYFHEKTGKHVLNLAAVISNQCAKYPQIAKSDCTHKLPVEGRFATTKHPDPALRKASNLVGVLRFDSP